MCFRLAKKEFDSIHDVQFYGIPVEVYVEDENDPSPMGAGRYSLFNDEWQSEPTKDLPDRNSRKVRTKVRSITNEVKDLIEDRVDIRILKTVKGKDEVSTQEVKEIIQPIKDPCATVEKAIHWTLTLRSNSFCFTHQKQMSRTLRPLGQHYRNAMPTTPSSQGGWASSCLTTS